MKNLILSENLFDVDDSDLISSIDRERFEALDHINRDFIPARDSASIDLTRTYFEGDTANLCLSGDNLRLDHRALDVLRKLRCGRIRFFAQDSGYSEESMLMLRGARNEFNDLNVVFDMEDGGPGCSIAVVVPGRYMSMRNISLRANDIFLGSGYNNYVDPDETAYIEFGRNVHLETVPRGSVNILLNWNKNENIENALDRLFKNRPVINSDSLVLYAVPLRKFYLDRTKGLFVGGLDQSIIDAVCSYTDRYKFRYIGIKGARGGYACIMADGTLLDSDPR